MPDTILLMRDIVDNQIVECDGRRITKVAGVEAEWREGQQPVVRALLIGPQSLARRFGRRTGRLMEHIGGATTLRISMSDVVDVGPNVRLRRPAEETGATRAEDWIRDHLIAYVPSLKRRGK